MGQKGILEGLVERIDLETSNPSVQKLAMDSGCARQRVFPVIRRIRSCRPSSIFAAM
jgi:hypothetical protein